VRCDGLVTPDHLRVRLGGAGVSGGRRPAVAALPRGGEEMAGRQHIGAEWLLNRDGAFTCDRARLIAFGGWIVGLSCGLRLRPPEDAKDGSFI
jgi:hypothetical protein